MKQDAPAFYPPGRTFKNWKSLPSTRYVGSKRKLVEWIWESTRKVEFDTFLEIFGGAGSLSYFAKMHGKEVTYNDRLKFNHYIGTGLIENDETVLTAKEIESILSQHESLPYDDFVSRTFQDVYFTPDENQWLDTVVQNISAISDRYKRALSMYSLFQSCIIKRPYNSFHRANLYMRLAAVERSFGNLSTWNRPFDYYFRKFALEANECVFSNGQNNRALNLDALDIDGEFDLVYVDSPYMSSVRGGFDYREYYHFLEGLSNYKQWPYMIDNNSKRRILNPEYSIWLDEKKIKTAFDTLFDRFRKSVLLVSYKSGGIPGAISLKRLLKKYKSEVSYQKKYYKYALAKTSGWELLFLAK